MTPVRIKQARVVGNLTLLSMAHQKIANDKAADGAPASQAKTRVLDPATGRSFTDVPFISANSVRGQIRRYAAHLVLDAQLAKGNLMRRELVLNLLRGATSRTSGGGTPTMEQMMAARRHVFAGVFGGGPNMLPSNLAIRGDLLPLIPETRALLPGFLAQSIADWPVYVPTSPSETPKEYPNGQTYRILGEHLLTGRDDMLTPEVQDYLEDPIGDFDAHISNVTAAAVAKKESKAAAKAAKESKSGEHAAVTKAESLKIFGTVECIIPGTRLVFDSMMKDPTEAQLGLYLLALESFVNYGSLGGMSSRGFGRFAPVLELRIDRQILERGVRDDNCVPVAGGDAGEQLAAVRTLEIGLGRSEDIGAGVELDEVGG
ncbi:MAG: type IV CRISPR-associated protein Csf2, partial [Betaproteobacteria bacterium]